MISRPLASRIAKKLGKSLGDCGASGVIPVTPIARLTIVSFGESNSGGQVANTAAYPWEVDSRSELDILNLNTLNYEPIDLGTNNNLGHFGLDSTVHAWELGLANLARIGFFGNNRVALVQAGQGGSRLSQWAVDGTYWGAFIDRTDER